MAAVTWVLGPSDYYKKRIVRRAQDPSDRGHRCLWANPAVPLRARTRNWQKKKNYTQFRLTSSFKAYIYSILYFSRIFCSYQHHRFPSMQRKCTQKVSPAARPACRLVCVKQTTKLRLGRFAAQFCHLVSARVAVCKHRGSPAGGAISGVKRLQATTNWGGGVINNKNKKIQHVRNI